MDQALAPKHWPERPRQWRGAARIERERRVQSALADFFHAQGEVERIQARAEIDGAPYEATIRDAVLTLDGLGETRVGIAELTGLPLARVRHYISGALVASSTRKTATGAPGAAGPGS